MRPQIHAFVGHAFCFLYKYLLIRTIEVVEMLEQYIAWELGTDQGSREPKCLLSYYLTTKADFATGPGEELRL